MSLYDACQMALEFLKRAEDVLAKSPLAGEAEMIRRSLASALKAEDDKPVAAFGGGDWRRKTPNYTVSREGFGLHVFVKEAYDIRDRLKAAGFKWDGDQRVWRTRDPISEGELAELVLATGMVMAGSSVIEAVDNTEIPL
jgi:hypothetical protein